MKIILVILSLGLSYCTFSQYTGGQGDGYASVEIQLEVIGLNSKIQSVGLYPTNCKAGSQVFFDGQYQEVYLLDVTGSKIDIEEVSNNYFGLPSNLNSGVYIVVFQKDDYIINERIIVRD